jgi:hypothetical protein
LPYQHRTSAYNTFSPSQEFSFTNHADSTGTHFDTSHSSFAVAVCVTFMRYKGMLDMVGEVVDTRHFPLTQNLFNKHSGLHETFVLDRSSGTKYPVSLSVEWEDTCAGSTVDQLRESFDGAGPEETEALLDKVRAELTLLGINISADAPEKDKMETEAICKLALHFYGKRKELQLDPPEGQQPTGKVL